MAAESLNPEEEQEELVIQDASPELKVRVLETLPLPIEFGEAYLTAKGIDCCAGNNADETVRNEYYRQCLESRIIPNSTLTLITSRNSGLFYPKREPVEIPFYREEREETQASLGDALVQGLVRGGKFAAIKYDIRNDKAFSIFKRDHLHQTLDLGYEIEDIDLALTSYSLSGYNQGTYYGTTLLVGSRGIRIKEGTGIEKLYDTLKTWFLELKGQQRLLER